MIDTVNTLNDTFNYEDKAYESRVESQIKELCINAIPKWYKVFKR